MSKVFRKELKYKIIEKFFPNIDKFYNNWVDKIRDKKLQSDVSCVIYEYIINPANYSRQIIAYSNYLDKNN